MSKTKQRSTILEDFYRGATITLRKVFISRRQAKLIQRCLGVLRCHQNSRSLTQLTGRSQKPQHTSSTKSAAPGGQDGNRQLCSIPILLHLPTLDDLPCIKALRAALHCQDGYCSCHCRLRPRPPVALLTTTGNKRGALH